MRKLGALYFPYASVQDSGSLKSALLYFDKIWVISSEVAFHETQGEFGELLRDEELVGWINGQELLSHYDNLHILEDAIQIDLSDQRFLELTRRDLLWEIYEDKGISSVRHLIHPIRRSSHSKILVPYSSGEAFLLNMALLAMTDPTRRLVPFSDDEEHLTILRHKLRRSAKGQLERLYGETLERGQIEGLVSAIAREAVESVLPTPEAAQNIPIERIKEFRQEYAEERDKLCDGVFSLIEEILHEEPSISPARLKMRIQTLLNVQLRRLEHDMSWKTRISSGIRTVLKVAETTLREFKTMMAGVPIEYALASAAPTAGTAVLDYIDRQAATLRTSDVIYLYRVHREFRPRSRQRGIRKFAARLLGH